MVSPIFLFIFAHRINYKQQYMITKREKHKYETPSMSVFDLKQQPQLLTASIPDYFPEEW